MPLSTAQDSKTIPQIEANAVFCHNEFGIRAGLPTFSRHFIHPQNAGIIAPATQRRAMFWALWMLVGLLVIILYQSISVSIKYISISRVRLERETYAKT